MVNGHKLHTKACNEGNTTHSWGVCAKGASERGIENEFYGMLNDVVEIEYSESQLKSVFYLVVTSLTIHLIVLKKCIKILILWRLGILDNIGNMICSYL